MMTSLSGVGTILLKRLISRAKCAQSSHSLQKGIWYPASEIVQQHSVRWMSQNKGFLTSFIENIKSEINKNVEMKESLKKFREDAAKLEQSESLQKARQKYNAIETETVKSSETFRKKISDIQDKVKETIQESDYAKKGKEIAEDVAETVGKAAEKVSKQGEQIAQSQMFKTMSSGVKAVSQEIKDSTEILAGNNLYKAPEVLRRRDHFSVNVENQKPIDEDTMTTGVVLTKESRWFQSWEKLKNNNPIIARLFDMKANYNESSNIFVRATRSITERAYNLFGGMFSDTELSRTLTEIIKVDPNFDLKEFLSMCKSDFIPNIVEARRRGDLSILDDWCGPGAFNILSMPIKEAAADNLKLDLKILDIDSVDIVGGQIMDDVPVLFVTFLTQEIRVTRNSKGDIVNGDPEKIIQTINLWGLAKDQEVFDPRAAWKVVAVQMSEQIQWL